MRCLSAPLLPCFENTWAKGVHPIPSFDTTIFVNDPFLRLTNLLFIDIDPPLCIIIDGPKECVRFCCFNLQTNIPFSWASVKACSNSDLSFIRFEKNPVSMPSSIPQIKWLFIRWPHVCHYLFLKCASVLRNLEKRFLLSLTIDRKRVNPIFLNVAHCKCKLMHFGIKDLRTDYKVQMSPTINMGNKFAASCLTQTSVYVFKLLFIVYPKTKKKEIS